MTTKTDKSSSPDEVKNKQSVEEIKQNLFDEDYSPWIQKEVEKYIDLAYQAGFTQHNRKIREKVEMMRREVPDWKNVKKGFFGLSKNSAETLSAGLLHEGYNEAIDDIIKLLEEGEI